MLQINHVNCYDIYKNNLGFTECIKMVEYVKIVVTTSLCIWFNYDNNIFYFIIICPLDNCINNYCIVFVLERKRQLKKMINLLLL